MKASTCNTIDGVLVVAHGTITDLKQLPSFLTAIRRGRTPSDALLAEMQHRYSAIDGFPLLTTTLSQAEALSGRIGKPVLAGMRFGEPSIESALQQFERLAKRRVLILPLAPYSVDLYAREVQVRYEAMTSQREQPGTRERLSFRSVAPWGAHPGLVAAHVQAIRAMAAEAIERGASVVLSAHSLPMQVIEAGDRYAQEIETCGRAIERSLGQAVHLCFQSQGKDGGRWLGPDLKDVVSDLAARGQQRIVVAPFGFLVDQLETLYDLDIELRAQTDALGLTLVRVPALGVHPLLMDTLAELVSAAVVELPEEASCH